jgi:hypothetical protein
MKKILIIISVFLVVSSCKKIEDLNKNIKDPENVTGESLFTGAQKNVFDQMVSANVNQNIFRLIMQQWTETTYTDESNYDLVTRSIPDNHWDVLYRDVLKDLAESKKVIASTTYGGDATPLIKQNKLAIVEVMSVYTWSVLVETFGDIPYSQALDIQYKLPKYDDGLTIYKDLITRLNAAIVTLTAGEDEASFGNADNMYQGDVPSWIRFANSLKLRMGMVLADVDPAFSKTTVESAEILMTSNSDNARLVYGTSAPNTNPVYDDLVASGRHDFVPTNTIIDYMNSLNDPRRGAYFTQVDTGGTSPVYYGGIPGASNDFLAYSHVSDMIQMPNFEAIIFDYAEVEFLLAEAAARGYNVGGTAASHYNAGIEASILYWTGSTDSVASYLANPLVAYSTAPGDYKEKIGMQKWLALYNRGFESWMSWKMLDFPVLIAPEEAMSDVPVRLTYPIAEQTLNGANYKAASAAIGGDDVSTNLFFDKFNQITK